MELKTVETNGVKELDMGKKKKHEVIDSTEQTSVVEQAPAAAVPAEHNVPQMFSPSVSLGEAPKGVDKATAKADEIVGEVFGQAVVHTIATDDEVKKQLLSTAKQVVQDKASTIGDKAELESKAQHFLKHEDACTIFGYDEKTTSKFHVKVMATWVFILNTLYIFTIGGLVVAPISFIMHKIKVVIKKTWLAFLLAFLVYLLITVGIPLLTKWLVDLGIKSPDVQAGAEVLAMIGAFFRR